MFDLIEELVSLTFFFVVNTAFLLTLGKLFKAFCASHTFQSVHREGSKSIFSMLCKCVDVNFERVSLNIHSIGVYFVWGGVDKEGKSMSFAHFSRFRCVCCNVKRVAKLTLKDGWFELVANCKIIQLWPLLSKHAAVSLVGAERDKGRRRKIAFLVRSQEDRVEGQLS